MNRSELGDEFSSAIYFGGPDQPPGALRNVLAAHVAAVPPGGSINWVTYYFRDLRLAEALIQAYKRGVNVTLSLEGKPRIPHANDAVIAMLSGSDGLGDALRVVTITGIPSPANKSWKPQLHEKLYCFSHPKPVALIGSFNPSGNMPEEDPEIIREIGDQDRGYNALIGLRDPTLVEELVKHARHLHQAPPGLFYRFSADANRAIHSPDTTIHLWPRVRPHPVVQFLSQVNSSARVRVVASHIRTEAAVDVMIGLARRGVALEIFAESTLRRVTPKVERRLATVGIRFRRIRNPEHLPMHLKFVLIEDSDRAWSIFGSFNWTKPSFWLNHEIAAISSDPAIFQAFAGRWDVLENERG
ncbi:phospholipase D-like domain-containing protein [Nitrosovibrio tenuis]|uniref:phospholipase D n=1 Tax=Nitrosovibrio tenuis TaxID=1233 RepID=A0A1H7PIW5_9PROT|nr:phospholipase D-like domain-containing protein [Nitrosovibrio tenuis]SEL35710.1 Phosphatidylserine/phosphatidylglycerophosphate/cardiolipin synthase [Nitrosovibrio tenuis]